jgi:hypothetical protein
VSAADLRSKINHRIAVVNLDPPQGVPVSLGIILARLARDSAQQSRVLNDHPLSGAEQAGGIAER